ncbi:hypothetical protein MJ584_21925 [Klebsiella pneumoniae]|nr:hypothetical protein MJ584_21925 [Klebsiella pneumoniae]
MMKPSWRWCWRGRIKHFRYGEDQNAERRAETQSRAVLKESLLDGDMHPRHDAG